MKGEGKARTRRGARARDVGALAAALARPEAYPGDPSAAAGVRWLQTHLSHVFLTEQRVYKLRKPATFSFVDFSTQRERNADCVRELALNRRLAPDVYLGLAPVLASSRGFRVGELTEGASRGREHVVVMRRLRDGCDGVSLLARGAFGAREVDRVADCIAGFHARHGLGAPAPFTPSGWADRIARPMRANLAALRAAAEGGVVPGEAVAALSLATERAVARHAERLEQRRREGRAVDGHGDLHLQHVWFEGGAADPILIDCLEFDDELRRIDAASEVAFLAMDLRYRGAGSLGERFLARYAAARDDFGLYGVVDLFAAYRAAVRGKVAGLAAQDDAIAESQRAQAAESAQRHVALASELLAAPRPGALVVVCGTVGTGKSTVAHALADASGAVVISSDRTRKALAGLTPDARLAGAELAALYAAQAKEAVYGALLERAAHVMGSGRAVILDATHERAAQRGAALALARQLGARCALVEVTCAEETARARVGERQRRGGDPSDAGPERVAISRTEFEAVAGWRGDVHFTLATDMPRWPLQVQEIAGWLEGS